MKLFAAAILFAAMAFGQDPTADPLVSVSKNIFAIAKTDILRSADKVPDNLWSYQPTPDVRTLGQLFAHVADGQYEFCGVAAAADGKGPAKDIEKNMKTKAEIVPALKEAFAYCDSAYAKLNDTTAAQLVSFFGMKVTKLGAMDFNTAHTMEHYGNLVTYMRLKGIVPPSSEPRQPAASSKK
jgi:uncharacterized damage-inducible protein DinB